MDVKDDPLLKVEDLSTFFLTGDRPVKAVRNVSFPISRGEVFGLVGESGCGKTATALSILNLLPPPGRIMGGWIMFGGKNLAGLPRREMEKVRGGQIGMIFQEPLTSLNPVIRVGEQIVETLVVHRGLSRQEAKGKAVALLARVGLDRPDKRYLQYPHQLSGGQRQRVLIAIAVSCNPSLLIADEPTTALDVTIEYQILQLLKSLVEGYSMSLLFITHNLQIIRRTADRIGIMYTGRMVENSPVDDFFREPLHPYGRGLLGSIPRFSSTATRLDAIPGSVPPLSELPRGCTFHPRCRHAMEMCRVEEPPVFQVRDNRWVRCFLYRTS